MLGVQVPSFLCGVSPSGKAPVFGAGIKGSNPFTPDCTKMVELVDTLGLGSSS
jgi:hypothetical protein